MTILKGLAFLFFFFFSKYTNDDVAPLIALNMDRFCPQQPTFRVAHLNSSLLPVSIAEL